LGDLPGSDHSYDESILIMLQVCEKLLIYC